MNSEFEDFRKKTREEKLLAGVALIQGTAKKIKALPHMKAFIDGIEKDLAEEPTRHLLDRFAETALSASCGDKHNLAVAAYIYDMLSRRDDFSGKIKPRDEKALVLLYEKTRRGFCERQ